MHAPYPLHANATDGYNERRADCEAGVRALAIRMPRIRALRDVTPDDLEANQDALPERIYRRCRHVVTENARVERAAAALAGGDLQALGGLMRASHESMRDDFDISTRELDLLVDAALDADGTIGARLTGGGFGGCTVTLAASDRVIAVGEHLAREYQRRHDRALTWFVSRPAKGAHVVET